MKGLLLVSLFVVVTMNQSRSEDWTVEGKDYHNIKVGLVEADRVHITFDGGIGTVPLAELPPDLQKRFKYDPDAAKAIARQRDLTQAQAEDAISREKTTATDQTSAATDDDLRQKFLNQAEQARQNRSSGYKGVIFNVVKLSDNLRGYLARTTVWHYNGNFTADDGPTVLLVDPDQSYVDDDRAQYTTIYYCGTWQYPTASGATATVRVCTPNLDCAIKLYRNLHQTE